MSDLERRLEEDRALRDEARALFRNELAHMRQEATPKAIGERIAERVGAKADAASDAALDLAQKHGRTAVAALAAALSAGALWLARKPILSGLARLAGKDEDEAGPDEGSEGEDNDDE